MDWTVCSRETERDYTWDNSHASRSVSEYAQSFFAPAFEGSLTTSRFAVLLRCPGSLRGVMLCASVSTVRNDFRNRPIRTMVVLRAENAAESNLLAAFFAECLRKLDTKTLKEPLYDPNGPLAKAVESLYQTKTPDEFLAFCKSLKPVDGKECVPKNYRCANPRIQVAARKWLADVLPAAIAGDSPFLFALTDRLPTDVLASLGSMFDRGTVQIFSKATKAPEKLPEPASQKYRQAAAIGGAVLLVFLAVAIGTCSRGSRQDEVKPPTDGGTNTPTSRQDPVGLISPTANNSPTQEAVVTNSIKAVSSKTEKRKTEDE